MWELLISFASATEVSKARHPITTACPMTELIHVDVSEYSFEEFVSFLFDREIPTGNGKPDPWYYAMTVDFDAVRLCEFYIRLFRHPGFLTEKFSKSQLESGFWAIHGPALQCSVMWIISNTDLPFSLRQECIRSMLDLFKNLFAAEPLETSVQMWWDSLCYDWECGNRDRGRGGEDLALQDVLFETLANILALDSEICQGAALHGLGHLHHPRTQDLIQRFLEDNPALSQEQKDYALAAARFNIL
jgi:hypothetical protein